MEYIQLKEIVDIYLGLTHTPKYVEEGIPFLSVKDISDGKIDFSNCHYITEEEYKSLPKGARPQKGDMLFCRIGTIGKPIIIDENIRNFGSFVSLGFFRKKNNEYLLEYLKYWMNSQLFEKQVKQNVKGVAQINLNTGWLKEFIVPKKNVNEQIVIINQLDTIQETIDIRKKQIELLDELIKSQFVEMFGNVKETIRLGNCCEVHARIGWQSLTKDEHMKNGEYMLITGTDFKDNEIDYSTCVYVSKERYEMDKNIILKNDDILITKDGTIGKVAIVHNLQKPATLNGGVFVVRPTEIFNKEYIAYVFKGPLFTEFVNKSKTGATIKHLNQKHLVEFEIPMPSVEKQIEFSKIYKQIDKQKFEIKKSLEKIQELQESLMNKYFG